MEERTVQQYGGKSIYVEKNEGQIYMGNAYVEDASYAFNKGSHELLDYTPTIQPAIYRDEVEQIKDYFESLTAVNTFGMERFAKGLMWVMAEVLGMPREWMPWEADKKEGEYILAQIMKGGNFGHYDERLHKKKGKLGAVRDILTHNMHLLSHYPSDTLWSPVWIVWHKLWKVRTKRARRLR